jgi:hypothetical protein
MSRSYSSRPSTNARSLYDAAIANARPAICHRVPPTDGAENAACA